MFGRPDRRPSNPNTVDKVASNPTEHSKLARLLTAQRKNIANAGSHFDNANKIMASANEIAAK